MTVTAQKNVVANASIETVFFENGNVAYNWKTNQWTRQPAWADHTYYEVNDSSVVGLIDYPSNTPFIQAATGAVQTSVMTTGAVDANQGGRVVVNGVRPLINGGTPTVRVGVQDSVSGAVSWSASTSLNSRTGMANFRSEGRYVRVEVTIADAFTTVMGADVEFTAQGRV